MGGDAAWSRLSSSVRGPIRRRLQALVDAGISCAFCGQEVPRDAWDIDHAMPSAFDPEGAGLLDPENLRPVCRRCNRRAGQKIGVARRRSPSSRPKPVPRSQRPTLIRCEVCMEKTRTSPCALCLDLLDG